MGTPEFAVPALQQLIESTFKPTLVVTQPDRPKGRNRKLSPPPVKVRAMEIGIPVVQPENINSPDAVEAIAAVNPHVIVTAAYGEFLGKTLRELPTFGCLNLHPSLLPLYRGSSPVSAALLHGDTVTGNTIFRLTRKMDAGPILYQRKVGIDPQECYTELQDRLAEMGGADIICTLEMLQEGTITEIRQDHSQAVFCGKIEKEDTVIDWAHPAQSIHNKVRSLALLPGAMTGFRESPIKIIRTEVLEEPSSGLPGTITELVKNRGIKINTGDRQLFVAEVQPAGKKIMSAWAYHLGAHIKAGERFGHAD